MARPVLGGRVLLLRGSTMLMPHSPCRHNAHKCCGVHKAWVLSCASRAHLQQPGPKLEEHVYLSEFSFIKH